MIPPDSKLTLTTVAGAFETLSITTAQALPAALREQTIEGRVCYACRAFISVEDQDIRICFDGSTPNATNGHKLIDGASFFLEGSQNVASLKLIAVTGTAKVQVTSYFIR